MVSKTTGVSSLGVDDPDFSTGETPITKNTADIAALKKGKSALGFLDAGADFINAGYKFDVLEAKNDRNIMLANFRASEIESIGEEQSLKAETKGIAKGKRSLLSAVAQGQSVTGGIARSTQKGEETIGLINAMAIEDNAIRQAFGLRQQASLLQLETDLAEIMADEEKKNAVLSAGVSALGFM